MRRGQRSPNGSTLIEVLVVSFIICVLLGIIVPALQASRGTAARIQCLNNMRQVGLALQNYDQQFRVLPPGVVNPTGPIRNEPVGMHHGWILQLLPFMEQSGVAAAIDTNYSIYNPANQGVAATRLNSLGCPSDKNKGSFMNIGVTSYAGCHHDVEAPIDSDNHGVLFLNSHIAYEDITDGTGNTIYFGEKRIEGPDLGWSSGTRASLRNTGSPINQTMVRTNDPATMPVGGFSSYHPGGVNIAFGDGSIRFVRETIQMDVYQHLGHRADGETVGGDQF
jgi:prepilin-type processing-associated H-X9-DG protein